MNDEQRDQRLGGARQARATGGMEVTRGRRHRRSLLPTGSARVAPCGRYGRRVQPQEFVRRCRAARRGALPCHWSVALRARSPLLSRTSAAYARTYRQLFALRALTGISVGGTVPLLFSLLGDLVPPRRRSAVAAGVGIAQGAGVALGQVVAGRLGARAVDGAWRLPFVLVAVPAIALAVCVAFCEEPRCVPASHGLEVPAHPAPTRCCAGGGHRSQRLLVRERGWSRRPSIESASSGGRSATYSASAPICWRLRRGYLAACPGA